MQLLVVIPNIALITPNANSLLIHYSKLSPRILSQIIRSHLLHNHDLCTGFNISMSKIDNSIHMDLSDFRNANRNGNFWFCFEINKNINVRSIFDVDIMI